MTIQDRIDKINEAIAKSLRHESHIDPDILNITGFSTGVMRRAWNWLARIGDKPVYVELGCYGGGTLCAAMNNSPELTVVGVDNGSQDFGNPTIFQQLRDNVDRFKSGAKSVKLIEGDIFGIDLKEIPNNITCLFYDGNHDREFQAKALPHYFDKLADVALFLVDDFSWQDSVAAGTQDGFKALKGRVKIERQWILSDGYADSPNWHNSVGVFLISKVK